MDKRAVCLNCIDGRIQLPVIDWIVNNNDIEFVDMITEPGMDGLLSDNCRSVEDIRRQVKISIDKNNTSMIFIVGHYDCRGNPVDDVVHKDQIISSVVRVKREFESMPIVGLWVDKDWVVHRL